MGFKHFVITRFNLGQPNTEWEKKRLNTFSNLTYPSILHQTCPNFTWVVLCDPRTDRNLFDKLPKFDLPQVVFNYDIPIELAENYNPKNENIGPYLVPILKQLLTDEDFIVTTWLDSDDMLLSHYVETVQKLDMGSLGLYDFETGYIVDEINKKRFKLKWHRNTFQTLVEPVDNFKTVYYSTHLSLRDSFATVRHKISNDVPVWAITIHENNYKNNVQNRLDGHTSEEIRYLPYPYLHYHFDGLLSVDIPNGDGPVLGDLGLTVVHPFYNEKARFDLQVENWKKYDEYINKRLNVLLVDDSSKVSISEWFKNDFDLNVEVYRIIDDVKWNTPAALNLGITQAKTDWVFVMDSDCYLKSGDMVKLLSQLTPQKDTMYKFMRNRISNNPERLVVVIPPTCALLFHKDLYYGVGGFDEDFCGHSSGGYGMFDGDFNTRVAHSKRKWRAVGIRDVFITEYMEDMVGANIQTISNITKDHHNINKKLWYAKINGEIPRNTKIGNFKWAKTR